MGAGGNFYTLALGERQTVYIDPFTPPYTSAYFNWLFYDVYEFVCRSVLQNLHLSDAWIPTIARCITFAFGMATLFATYRLIRLVSGGSALSASLCLSLAILGVWNPVSLGGQ